MTTTLERDALIDEYMASKITNLRIEAGQFLADKDGGVVKVQEVYWKGSTGETFVTYVDPTTDEDVTVLHSEPRLKTTPTEFIVRT